MLTVSDNHIVLGGGGGGGGVPSGGSVGDLLVNSAPGVVSWAADNKVAGAASSTNNAMAVYDGTTGRLVKNSTLIVKGDNFNLQGQLEFNIAAGLVYFGNFGSPANNRFGFSTPGIVVMAVDGVTQRLGIGGAGAYFASYAPDALLHVRSRSTTDTTMLVQASDAQTSSAVVVQDNTGAIAFSVSAAGAVRLHKTLTDSVNYSGASGDVLYNASGLPVWSKPKIPTRTPSSSSDTANAGEIFGDANYIYYAYGTNQIGRIAFEKTF